MPYLKVVVGSAYSIQQTLEGLNLNGAEQPGGVPGAVMSTLWDLPAAMTIPLFATMAFVVVLCSLILAAGWSIGKRIGILYACIVLALPGGLSLLGMPTGNFWSPHDYKIGSGELGSPYGMLSIALLGLLTGWSVTVIVSIKLRLTDKYRTMYDHVWYAMAVTTGILFVADVGANNYRQHLEELNQDSRGASSYFLRQARALESRCLETDLKLPYACTWARDVQRVLSDYAYQKSALYWQLGPKTSSDFYQPNARDVDEAVVARIRKELIQLNNELCPVKRISEQISIQAPVSGVCERTPPSFVSAFPDPIEGRERSFDVLRTVAIANETLVPGLIRMRLMQERLAMEVKDASMSRHLRWLFYVMFSILAGGKVGNATCRLLTLFQRIPLRTVEPTSDVVEAGTT